MREKMSVGNPEKNARELTPQERERDGMLDRTVKHLEIMFDQHTETDDRTRELHGLLDPFLVKLQEKGVLTSEKTNEVMNVLSSSSQETEKAAFVSFLLPTIKFLIDLQIHHPQEFEQIQRERFVVHSNFEVLNKALSYDMDGATVHIHLAPIKTENLGEKRRLILDGLQKLAQVVDGQPQVEEITATSWIVAKQPKLLEHLGFVIRGQIDEQTRQEHFASENRPVWRATMTRYEFLRRYLIKDE